MNNLETKKKYDGLRTRISNQLLLNKYQIVTDM